MQPTGNTSHPSPVIRIGAADIHLALPEAEGSSYTYIHHPMSADGDVRQQLTHILSQHAGDIANTHQPLHVLIDSPYLFIPASEYVADEAEELYRYAVTDNDDPTVPPLYMPMLSTYVLFSVPKDIQEILQQQAPTVKYLPMAAPLWQYIISTNTYQSPTTLHAYIHDNILEVFAFNGTRFRFANRFTAINPNDILYYILYVWEQTGMQAEQDTLAIYGDMPNEEWLSDRLRSFLRHVNTHTEETLLQSCGITSPTPPPADIVAATIIE